MIFQRFAAALSALFLLVTFSLNAAPPSFDQQMKPLLEEYLKIQAALARDSIAGVKDAAARLEKLAGSLDASGVTGTQADQLRAIPGKLKSAAASLAAGKDLQGVREAFKELSKPMVLWASATMPEGISVFYCSMAPGSWLQRGTTVMNPYYGSEMLHCGEIVGGVGAAKK